MDVIMDTNPISTDVNDTEKSSLDQLELDNQIEERYKIFSIDGNLNTAIESLLVLEKQTRLAADVTGSKKVVLKIIRMCRESENWKSLNEHIILLSKRRAQLKQTVTAMVQEAMKYIEDAPTTEIKVDLIKTLSTVSVGKIYVEIERARLGRKLAKIKEENGEIKEAAEILQEIAVETFGAMAKTEKIAFILEQVRLCLDHGDYIRAQILSKKINPRVFAEDDSIVKKKGVKEGESAIEPADSDIPSLNVLKHIYYQLMIRYFSHTSDYLEICRCYQAIYESKSTRDDENEWIPVLKKICWYIVLSSYGSMQTSLLHATYADKKLKELPKFSNLLKKFITMEIIRWSEFFIEYKSEIDEESEIFGTDQTLEKKTSKDLQLRVIEHNILVISKYYSRITIKRLSDLLDLTIPEAEKHLSEMVVSKTLSAKIDRPSGVISFQFHKESNDLLNAWSGRIERLLDLVETSCHHIHKDIMVHKLSMVK